ncbi:endoribonuclease L-PSP [Corynascus similis CBS 632.67]
MSSLPYFNHSPFTGSLSERFYYSQAVRVGDRIECSGQGGWDPKTGDIPTSITAEVEQAFANVDACLRSAGANEGWRQVYRVNLYATELSEELFAAWAASAKKWAGDDHKPILTAVGVAWLGLPAMRVEIEVVAHAPPAQ